MPPIHRPLERRELLRRGALVIATFAMGGCASLFTKKRDPDLTVAVSDGRFRVPLSRVPWVTESRPGEIVVAMTGRDDKVLLFRDAAGALSAVGMTCTHRGCDVAWDAAQGRIACPCHGSQFSSGGAVLRGPAERPLTAYPVRVEADAVVVLVG